ncbi:hypothetical protein BLA29_004533 [Euroglyphus maynei]|uniref:Derlin n=1 Tax=Euroglyphus maynei TaxID=6958 RepID=A0A1Y3AY80_EURMA|nr:hypothetical protein BLA29_004533 [Euroglyphus maynei]
MDPLILSVLYVWCQLNKEMIVTFWFGTRFKAQFLPWVLLGFNMILGGGSVSVSSKSWAFSLVTYFITLNMSIQEIKVEAN